MADAVDQTVFDVAVIGGGVNGTGIARDAAGRGAKVLLLEAHDLASGTSSNSSKLIHGGLRYLEHFEFGLVREALGEREKLWAIAPHIIWPMRFVLAWVQGLRPRWLLRLGLFLYDHLLPADVVWTYSGVRPLVDDGSGKPEAATRGYTFEVSDAAEGAPMLSVFGGKITTFRTLSEEAVDRIAERIPALAGAHWTDRKALPGGDFGVGEVAQRMADLQQRYPFFEPAWAERMLRCYGTLAATVLGDAATLADCGEHFGQGLTELEVRYLIAHEWAHEADDILWRRTKLGLRLSEQQQTHLRRFMGELKAQ